MVKYHCEGCEKLFDRSELKPYNVIKEGSKIIFLCKKCEKVKEKYF